MHERSTLQEAEYFLNRMSSVATNPQAFQHELSAFMTASRSVLQYAHKEAECSSSGQSWYENAVRVDPILRYFKDKRDISVHSQPVTPDTQVSIGLSGSIQPTSTLHLVKQDEDGHAVEERRVGGPPVLRSTPGTTPNISYVHRFPDWQGSEDVLMRSQRYISSLKSFVDGGVAGGVIAG